MFTFYLEIILALKKSCKNENSAPWTPPPVPPTLTSNELWSVVKSERSPGCFTHGPGRRGRPGGGEEMVGGADISSGLFEAPSHQSFLSLPRNWPCPPFPAPMVGADALSQLSGLGWAWNPNPSSPPMLPPNHILHFPEAAGTHLGRPSLAGWGHGISETPCVRR